MAQRSLTDAPNRGWGAGWPRCQGWKMGAAHGGGVTVYVRVELVPLVAWLLNETAKHGYALRAASCGGFVCRPMKYAGGGYSRTASNHSWGLAIDLNWHRNGFGRHANHDLPEHIAHLWEAHGFNWGGRWGTPDWMHMEFAGTPGEAFRITTNVAAGRPNGPTGPEPREYAEVLTAPLKAPNRPTIKGREPYYQLDTEAKMILAWNGARIVGDTSFGPGLFVRQANVPKLDSQGRTVTSGGRPVNGGPIPGELSGMFLLAVDDSGRRLERPILVVTSRDGGTFKYATR